MTKKKPGKHWLSIPILFLFFLPTTSTLQAQGDNEEGGPIGGFTTFRTTRVINSHSVETLYKKDLDLRITHRFGDIAGTNGGYHSLFGVDRARDVRIALEYGVTDNIMVGLGRSKGAGPWRELVDAFAKVRLIKQKQGNGIPLTLTYISTVGGSTMLSSEQEGSPVNFKEPKHRLTYANQLLIGKRMGDRLSFQVMPTHVHRNLVPYQGRNDLFALGAAGTLKLTKIWGISGEYFQVFPAYRHVNGSTHFPPLSVGVEVETGGHVFHVNLTNSEGIGPNQFIPYTTTDWTEGEFRFGFTISRLFSL